MNPDLMENFRFSTLHKAVLRLDGHELKEEIEVHQSEIEAEDKDGHTALRWAAARGDNKAVSSLLKAGANANSQCNAGLSVLHAAARYSNLQIVQMLLKAGADPCQVDTGGYSVLHYVSGADAVNVIKCLVKVGVEASTRDFFGGTPLHYYVMRHNVEAAKAILNLGADIDLLNSDGASALVLSICRGSDDTTELLLSCRAKYTTWDSDGRSILHHAALFGGLRTLEILYNAKLHGIDPDALSHQGQMALQIAQARTSKPEDFVEKLQELFTDIRVRNANIHSLARADLDEHDVEVETRRSRWLQLSRYTGRLRLRDTVSRLAPIFLLLASTYLGSCCVYRVFKLDWLAKILARAWSIMSPGGFAET